MKPSIQGPLDQLAARLAALEANLNRTKTELRNLVLSTPGSIDIAIASLSGTIDSEFVSLSGSVDSAWRTGVAGLSGTIDARFASGYRLLGVQMFTGSVGYVPTSGTIAVMLTIVASGGGGGAGTTTAGAAGGGGASGEWAVIWYDPGTPITGQAVNVGASAASATAGNTSGIMIDGITFAAIGGTAGNTNTAIVGYAEADAPTTATSGSTTFDLYRGSNPSVAAMVSFSTGVGGTVQAYTAGLGGGTPYGKGGRGSAGDATGGNGSGYGSGGGGGRRGGITNRNGGASGAGLVIVEEYGH